MVKKGILLLQEARQEHQDEMKKLAPNYELVWEEEDGYSNDFPEENIEIIYGWGAVGNKIIDNKDNQVKWIHTSSSGVDYLPLDKLNEQGVRVTNVSGIHSVAIAESVIAMMLYRSRGLDYSVKQHERKEWKDLTQLFELNNQTMLIIGTGNIGKEVARLAKAFNMRTIGINRSGQEVEHIDELYTQENLFEHIHKADVIVNILPLTKETKYLYDMAFFKKMKKEGTFINVGRGPSVKTDDLIQALKDGELAFAGLDVVEEEPLPSDHPLWDVENVLITPHISGVLEDYSQSVFSIFSPNLKAYVAGQPFELNQVDLKKGY